MELADTRGLEPRALRREGSSPSSGIIFACNLNKESYTHYRYSKVAQPVEQVAVNHWVAGSSPALGEFIIILCEFIMAITASAKKAIKRSRFLRARNLIFKESMKKSIKLFKKSVLSNESNDVVQANLVDAYSAIDKAARKNIIHKNNAARKKSRLAKMAVAS